MCPPVRYLRWTSVRGAVTMPLVFLTVSLAGCGLFTEDAALDIKTDRTSYSRGSTIKVTAKNVSSHVIFYNSCMPAVLEELTDGRMAKETHFPTCACLCVSELKPGEKWEWGLDVDWLWANEGMFEPEIGPRHRLRFAFYEDSKLKNLIRQGDLTTNTFRFHSAD